MFALEKSDGPSPAGRADEPASVPPAAGAPTSDDEDGSESSAGEYDHEDIFCDALCSYMGRRNITSDDIADPFFTDKAIIEYINLKFIDNNLRSVGLNKIFDEYNLTQARLEFKSFEKWFSGLQKYVAEKIRSQDLCLPLFCHLYLNLYSENEHQLFLTFLDIFKHIFVCPKGNIFLRELKNVNNMNNLPPYLSLFRKNKIVFKTTPEFLTSLYYFFQRHFLLKAVFQEWFDVNYSCDLDPLALLHSYFINSLNYLPQINHKIKKHNISDDDSSEEVIHNKNITHSDPKPNSSSPKGSSIQEQVSNSKENPSNHFEKSKLNGRKKLSSSNISCSESLSGDSFSDSTSETSFSDEEILMRKFFNNKINLTEGLPFKSSYHLKASHTTKIDPIKIYEDSYYCTTRQICLKNCSKLTCSILTSDHKYVAAGSLDSLVYLWERSDTSKELNKNGVLNSNTKNGIGESDPKPLKKGHKFVEDFDKSAAIILRGHGGSVIDLAEISSSKILLSASIDKTFRAWDLVSKLCLEVYDGHEHKTWCVSACPNTLQVVTGSSDGNGCLWFLDYKRPLRIFPGHLDDVLVVKIHPSQVILATGSADKTIRVFELVSGVCQRLFVGHNDYISCIEFNVKNPRVLASASGSGEVILWDMPTGDVLWSIKVADVLLSSLTWVSDDVMLASLSTGVILKCNIKENYSDESKLAKGFTTKFCRLLSLKIIDDIVYSIGVPGKFSLRKKTNLKPSPTKIVENKLRNRLRMRALKDPSPFKLFFQQHIKSNGDLLKPVSELNSKDLKNQLTINPSDTTLLTPEFFQMDGQNLPFKVTPDEVAKLNSQYISNDIKLIKKPPTRTKSAKKNTSHTSTLKSGEILKPLSASSSPSQISNLQPSDSNQSSNAVNLQHLKPQNPTVKVIHSDIKNNLQLQTNGESDLTNNVLIQQQPMLQGHDGKISAGVDQQRTKLKAVSRTRLTKQPSKKSILQKEQKMQNFAEGNIISNPSVPKQPLYQQIRPTSPITKMNIQQRLSQQQTTIRLGNVKVSKTQQFDFNTKHLAKPSLSSSAAGMPIRWSIAGPHKTIIGNQLPIGDSGQLSPTSGASLLNNPEMLSGGQPVIINERTRSQSVTRLSKNPKSNLQTESPQKKKP